MDMFLRVNAGRVAKKVLNMKLKGRHPRRRPRSRWEEQVRKDMTRILDISHSGSLHF
jgi:hypothetical protein